MIPIPDFRETSVPAGLRSFADDETHHFKGNPNYVIKDGPNGKRYHLAHPQPDLLKEHLEEIAGNGRQLHVFGWQRQSWDGSKFGDLGHEESKAFADATGCANADEWVKRLTAGLPFEGGVSADFSVGSNEDIDVDAATDDIRYEAAQDGWDVEEWGDGGGLMRTRSEYATDEDGDIDYDADLVEETEYYNHRTGEWQSKETTSFEDKVAPSYNVFIKHPELGSMSRSIYYDPDTGQNTAYQAYWEAGKTGGGLSTHIYQSQFEAYAQAGVDKVKVHANISVGGYAWARHGFDLIEYGNDDLDDFRTPILDSLEEAFEAISDSGEGDPHNKLILAPLDAGDFDDLREAGADPHNQTREEFHESARNAGWAMPDTREALYDHMLHGTDGNEEAMARHTLRLVGKTPDDFDTGHELVDHLLEQREIGATPEAWEEHRQKMGELQRGRNRLADIRGDWGGDRDQYLADMERYGNDPSQVEKEISLALQPRPPLPPGRERFNHSEIATTLDGWKSITGWDHETDHESPMRDAYDELRSHIESMTTLPELASAKTPPELEGHLDVNRLVKRTLIGSDWYGEQDIGRVGGSDPEGNQYRAQKLLEDGLHREPVPAPEQTGTPPRAGDDSAQLASAVLGGRRPPTPPAVTNGEIDFAAIVAETRRNMQQRAAEAANPNQAAWNRVLTTAQRPTHFNSAVDVANLMFQRLESMPEEDTHSTRVALMNHYRDTFDRGAASPQESPRWSGTNWQTYMDDANPERFATPEQVLNHAREVQAGTEGNIPEHQLYDHWDLRTRNAGQRVSASPESADTTTLREARRVLGAGFSTRNALPDSYLDYLDHLHEHAPDATPQEIASALRYWYSGETRGPERLNQIQDPGPTMLGLNRTTSDFGNGSHFDAEPLREHLLDGGARIAAARPETTQYILSHVRQGRPRRK